jgi:hypothetical protein
MKLLLATATALSMSGAALAWQTTGTMGTQTTGTQTHTGAMGQTQQGAAVYNQHTSLDPTITLQPHGNWTAQQRTMFDQHMGQAPAHWTEQQRMAFQQQLRTPPAQWTQQQRDMYGEQFNNLPTAWTEQQRLQYQQQMAGWREPWGTQTAFTDHPQQTGWSAGRQDVSEQQMAGTTGYQGTGTATQGTTLNQQNQTATWDQQGQGATWNQQNQRMVQGWAGMGGPYEEAYGQGFASLQPRAADTNYPPCSPGPGDDRCIQLYEPGVRQALASWDRNTGGLAGGAEVGMGGPLEDAHDDQYRQDGQDHHQNQQQGTTQQNW